MQIVIDIDENVFTRLFNKTEEYAIVNDDLFALAKAIRKSTPLPKGHGRLKDVDEIMRIHHSITDMGYTLYNALVDAPTIIEEDKE